MKILDVAQGSDEWLATRDRYHCASDASGMMGCNPHLPRGEMVKRRALSLPKEYSKWVEEVLFPRGHEIEELGRPLAEEYIDDLLYPQVVTDDEGYLLASLDGISLISDIVWECKQWNESKAEIVRNGLVPQEDAWQVVQQLTITRAEKALYTLTDGTPEKTLHAWFTLNPADRDVLLASWKQFDEDVKNYQHVEEAPKMEGKAPETLPALRIELTGMVSSSNLPEFKRTALAVISAVNTDLQTDADFLDAEKAVKWCKEVETRLDAAKQHALSQTATIDELFRTLDEIKEEARTKRLYIEKLVKTQKDSIRIKIMGEAEEALRQHYATVNATLPYNMNMPADFKAKVAEAIKGKKTIISLREASGNVLTNAKIEASLMADKARANLKVMESLSCPDQTHLFPDVSQLVFSKAPDDFQALVKSRIADHKEAERKKEEALRERIRKEEEAKALKAAEAEREKIREQEIERFSEEQSRIAALNAKLQKENDQRGKTAEATHGEPMATASPQAPAASTPPIQTPGFRFQAPPENTSSDMDITLAWLKSLRNGDGLVTPSGLTDKKCLGAIEEVVKKVQVVVKTVITKLEK